MPKHLSRRRYLAPVIVLFGDFASGVTLTSANQVLQYGSGLYRALEDLPYTTDGATPSADGGEWYVVSDGILESVARSLNATDDKIVYSSDTTTTLDDVLYIYDNSTQITYGIPALTTTGETIVSVNGGELTTSTAEVYDLMVTGTENTKINIKLFGALGNDDGLGNGNDDTLAVQNAIDYCVDNGFALEVPAGDYRITSQITADNVIEIIGERASLTIYNIF